jgi:hypothetical protein
MDGVEKYARWFLAVVLVVFTWRFARMPIDGSATASFLHLPNLVFHEAGHVLFIPFGRFMTVLGGSLTQVLVPGVCAVAFLRQENPFAAAVCAWWAGENLIDLAPYIADARALRLPLLGGATGAEVEGHDWEYVLGTLGWLHLDRGLGRAVQIAGVAVMLASTVWAAYGAWAIPSRNPSNE